MKHFIFQNFAAILLTVLCTAVVMLDGSKAQPKRTAAVRNDSDWVPIFHRNQTKIRAEHYHRGRYSEYRIVSRQSKYRRPNSNYNEWRPHFPAPAHRYLSSTNKPPSILDSYAPVYPQTPYSPPKIQSYERPASIYPTAYYTKPTRTVYRKPSYSSPSSPSSPSYSSPSYPSPSYPSPSYPSPSYPSPSYPSPSYPSPSYSSPSYPSPSYPSPSYSSQSYFPPAHFDVPKFPLPEPEYPSIYYNDFKRVPQSYKRPRERYVNKPIDFPDFDEFLRQSIAFQHFRP